MCLPRTLTLCSFALLPFVSLESEYGVKLFHRVGRHIEITEIGRLLQLEAQRILTQITLTERGLAEFNDLQRGELQLGSSLTIGNYWLPAKISDFQERYPAIKINCTLANTEEICLGRANGSKITRPTSRQQKALD